MAVPIRTLPYEMVMACKRDGFGMEKRYTSVQARSLDLYTCANERFTEKYGSPKSIVDDRMREIARRVAGGIAASRDAQRRRKRRK